MSTDKGSFDSFISHFKAEASGEARLFKIELETRISKRQGRAGRVYLDSDNLNDLDGLLDTVRHASSLVLLLSPRVLERPWCVLELVAALGATPPVKVVPVDLQRRGGSFGFAAAAEFVEALPTALEAANPGASLLLAENDVTIGEAQTVPLLGQLAATARAALVP